MKAADLKRAVALADDLRVVEAMARRIFGEERLRMVLGEGSTQSEIVLDADYLDLLRREVARSLKHKAEALAEDLRALGVEP